MKCFAIFCCVFGILNDHFGACKLIGRTCLEPESGTDLFCCRDYYANNNGTCIECDEGFTTRYGKKPCKKCPFPKYGRRCTNDCSCTRERCDHVKGCVENDITNKTPQGGLFETTTQTDDSGLLETTTQGKDNCDKGFTTTNGYTPCKKCPFPMYGMRCTHKCNCTAERCDHVNGCVKNTVTTPQGGLAETTTQKCDNNDTSVLYILYSGGGFLVVFGLLLLIAAGIRFKLRYVKKNAQDKPVTIQDEQLYEFIAEDNVAPQISNKNIEENCPYLPPPDVSLSVPMDFNEEKEYDYTYNADGYLNPYDGLKIPDFKDHLYNELHKKSEKH